MYLSVYNFDSKQFQNMIKCEIVLNQTDMTEQLICGNQVIYKAPICTCLSCLLNDHMEDMQKLTSKSIHRSIAATLKTFGATLGNDERLNDDTCSHAITAELLGMDNTGSLMAKLNDDKDNVLHDAFSNATEMITLLSQYERMFFRDVYWDHEGEKTQHDVLKDILSEYIANLNTDPLCKELSFFHHIFYNEAYYTIHDGSLLWIYYQKDSDMTPEFLFKHLRSTYISLHQGQSRYIVRNYQDICVLTLYFALQNKLSINKCKNCARYFIPLNRSDEIYCDNPAPQNPKKTCKQYGKTTGSYEKNKSDPALKMCRDRYNSKQMLVRRNPDIQAYADNFERFKKESAVWKNRYKSGECTADEFIFWLNEQKGKKT